MFKNFLTIAWRSLLRNKLHSFINVTGLAIGVSACMVIYLIVNFELSFNKELADYERIYRIHSQFSGVYSGLNRGAPTAVGGKIRDEFKGVETVTSFQISNYPVTIPQKGEKNKIFENQDRIVFAEPSFFTVFSNYEWIAGSADVLKEPFQVVLTESRAKTYFGTDDVTSIVGKEILYRDSLSTTVAGIVKDLPFNTDIDMTDFISYSTIEKSWVSKNVQINDWGSTNSSSQVFVKLDRGSDFQTLKDQLPILATEYKKHSSWADNLFNAQPISDLHYNNETGIFDYSRSAAHLPTLTILIVVAVLLLAIGAINFVNLETAQSVRRAKEVGVRKTLGSSRAALLIQFLAQSFIITFAAIMLALPLTEFALSSFSDFVPPGVHLSLLEVLPFLIGIIFVIGLLAGLYPAFVLSSFIPALALKNQAYANSSSTRSAYLRKALIVFQFSIAQVLIIGALAVGWQINYMLKKDIGFEKDAIVYFYTPWTEKTSKIGVLKNELTKIKEVVAMSLSDAPPSANGWSSSTVEYKPETGDPIKVTAFRKFGDPEYLAFYNLKLAAGKNLRPTDSLREFIINRTLLSTLNFSTPEEAIGKTISYGDKAYPIIGVVEDFHIQSLHKKIEPVIIGNDADFNCFNIRLSTANGSADFKEGIAKIEEAWKKVYPDAKFKHSFLDETLEKFYESEQRTSKLVKTAMFMAIFISCLGLFGLASFTTTQRMKEISIRKVLGSSVSGIVIMLSKDFIILILIAFMVASPLAWIAVNRWLDGFAYHMDLNVWLFMVTVIIGVLIAFITVGYQTLKAANSNPVNALRNE